MAVLVDTNVWVAYLVERDARHSEASTALLKNEEQIVVAAPVMVELSYLLVQRLGYNRMVGAIRSIRSNYLVVPLTEGDQARLEDIMLQYADAAFDYTDAAIMALSERLNITRLYTFDRRDFLIFRPAHGKLLELLP